ncbi:MAG: hypothetical protein ACRC8K_00760 [Waterburya sp.]
MIPIFKLVDILHTPEGIALAGAYSSDSLHQSLDSLLCEINQRLDGLSSISYLSNSSDYQHLPLQKVQYTTSIGDRVNLFLLLGHLELPPDLVPGTLIYPGIRQPFPSAAQLSIS